MATTYVTVDQGFDEAYYLAAKAAQMTASTGQTWTVSAVQNALSAAGLTAEEHYSLYGYAEGLSPNAYYNDDYYAASKAAELNAESYEGRTNWTADEFRVLWQQSSGSSNLYTHYMTYGSTEDGVNPSSGFDDDSYYAAKAAHDGTTVAEAKAAIQDAGLNAVSHYLLYGQYENLSYTPSSVPAGTTQTLTISQDTFTGADFSAPLVTNSAGHLQETLQTVDSLNGSGTTAVLNASLQNDGTTPPTPTMTNVATVNLTSYAENSSLDASLITGTTTWGDINSAKSLVINNIQQLPSSFVMQNVTSAGFSASIVNGAMTGTADAVGLTLNGVTNAGGTSIFTIANATAGGTAVIETLNINTTGAASALQDIVLPGDTSATTGLHTINITGDQNLSVTNALGASITTVNAADFTGNLTLNLSNSAHDLTVTGGHGADTLNLATAANVTVSGGDGNDAFSLGTHLDGGDVIDGGSGVNTLSANIGSQAITGLHIANIQTLDLVGATTSGTIDLSGVTGITTLHMGSQGSSAAIDTVTHAGSDLTTIDFTSASATGAAQTFSGLSFGNSYSGTSDTLAVNINNGGTALAGANLFTVGALTLNGAEHVGITVADGGATLSGGISGTTLSDLTLTASGSLTTTGITGGTLTANSITSVNATGITGNADLGTITGLLDGATITLGNGGSNVAVTTNAFNTASDFVHVTGGTGADTLSAAGWAGNSILSGGAGADTLTGGTGTSSITGGTGNDTLTAGAGTNTFSFAEGDTSIGSTTTPGHDTITNYGTGTNIIHDSTDVLSAMATTTGGLTINGNGLVTGGAADVSEFVTHASASSTAGAAAVYDDGTHSYIFISDGSAGLTDGDLLIQLTGVNTLGTGLTISGHDITAVA